MCFIWWNATEKHQCLSLWELKCSCAVQEFIFNSSAFSSQSARVKKQCFRSSSRAMCCFRARRSSSHLSARMPARPSPLSGTPLHASHPHTTVLQTHKHTCVCERERYRTKKRWMFKPRYKRLSMFYEKNNIVNIMTANCWVDFVSMQSDWFVYFSSLCLWRACFEQSWASELFSLKLIVALSSWIVGLMVCWVYEQHRLDLFG